MTKYFLLFVFGLQILGCTLLSNQQEKEKPSTESIAPKASYSSDSNLMKESSGPKKRLMVLPFIDLKESRPVSLRESARNNFIKELNKTNYLIAIDSSDLKLDLTKFYSSGEYKLDDISKPVASMGVVAILEGRIEDIRVKRTSDEVGVFRQLKTRFEAVVRVRMLSTRSAKELINTVKTVTLDEAQTRVAENVSADRMLETNPELINTLVTDAFLDFTPQITAAIDRLGWEGRIAMINGDRIFINVGKISGVQVGDLLKVSDEGDDVYDPQTGRFIGKVQGRLKGTLEGVSYFGQDGSIAIIHSGAGFKENDRVELY